VGAEKLTDLMKEQRKTVAQELLNQCRLVGDDFLENNATGDDSWDHHYDPKKKQKSNPWNIVIRVKKSKTILFQTPPQVLFLILMTPFPLIFSFVT
jgi:hypothetical protein